MGSHDTARIATVIGVTMGRCLGASARVGVALLFTMPGAPMVFAGDELGLAGVNGEDARRPMPWHRQQSWNDTTLAAYRELGRATECAARALRRGGLRWLGADGDSMTYLREHPEQTVLVHLTRAQTAPTSLPLAALGPDVRGFTTISGAQPRVEGDHVLLPGDGPASLAAVVR